MKTVLRLGLLGGSGRMGRKVVQVLGETEYQGRIQLVSAPPRGGDLTPLLDADVLIDFALPEAVVELLEVAGGQTKVLPALVVASTGWKAPDLDGLRKLGKSIPILQSSNFSVGALALRQVLKNSAPFLARLGYQPVVLEIHHKMKRDAPSGTAKMLRDSLTQVPDGFVASDVEIHSIRAGDVIGDHEAQFFGTHDRIVLAHYAQDRAVFARGAIEAACWLAGRGPGFYTLEDFFKEAVLSRPSV
ncbi:MAG: dihydrodipicolinate reductase C-terminal domain-containing protein [Bdellovibrionota bacterium]